MLVQCTLHSLLDWYILIQGDAPLFLLCCCLSFIVVMCNHLSVGVLLLTWTVMMPWHCHSLDDMASPLTCQVVFVVVVVYCSSCLYVILV
jgi:hypothetical protein